MSNTHDHGAIDVLYKEERLYKPSESFVNKANWNDKSIYEQALDSPVEFWEEMAKDINWFKKWDKTLEWNAPWAKWFVGAELNISYNCVDRHLETWRKNKAAIISLF